MTRVAISVDVEPDLTQYVRDGYLGIEAGLPALLRVLDEHDIRVDLFVTASLLPRFRDRIATAIRGGHIIGLHGVTHRILAGRTFKSQFEEIQQGRRILQEQLGVTPNAFRAPNFGVDANTFRAISASGFLVDSSILPGRIVRKWRIRTVSDHRGASAEIHGLGPGSLQASNLVEVPLTENPFRPGTPLGLGSLHSSGYRKAVDALLSVGREFITFLIHPWECIDLVRAYPEVPSQWRSHCSTDLSELSMFLEKITEFASFTNVTEASQVFMGERERA